MKKKKLTRRKALEICRELWQWIWEKGFRLPSSKLDWPEWEKYGKMHFACPCCEYVKQFGKMGQTKWHCRKKRICPLHALWPEDKDWGDVACENPKSAYGRWQRVGTKRTARKYAKMIVDACDKELAKYKRS